jgi:hypothetical protein
MSRQRFTLLLIVALVVISAAIYVSTQRNQSRETQGGSLLPTLAAEMNSITAVSVRKGSPAPSLTVHKTGDLWTVAERADYPADVAKLRKLLLALRDAKIIDEKTADPGRYADLGVEDPAQAGSIAVEVTVATPAATHALIVGKPVGEGNFVRRTGEKQSYSVEPAISLETEPRFWIDSRFIDAATALIQSIEVKPAGGPTYSLHRLNATDNTFSLDGAPAARKPLDAHALAPPVTLLAGLTAEDVSPAGAIDFGQSSQAIVTLSDGNVITLTGAIIADKHWLKVQASKDAALTAKAEGRAFEVASYRYDAIFKPLDGLLAPPEVPVPKAGPAAAAHAPKKPQPAASAPASP